MYHSTFNNLNTYQRTWLNCTTKTPFTSECTHYSVSYYTTTTTRNIPSIGREISMKSPTTIRPHVHQPTPTHSHPLSTTPNTHKVDTPVGQVTVRRTRPNPLLFVGPCFFHDGCRRVLRIPGSGSLRGVDLVFQSLSHLANTEEHRLHDGAEHTALQILVCMFLHCNTKFSPSHIHNSFILTDTYACTFSTLYCMYAYV